MVLNIFVFPFLFWRTKIRSDERLVYTCAAGRTSRVTECFDQSVYPLKQSKPCNGDCGQWKVELIGQWSDCLLLSDTSSSAAQLEQVGTVRAGTAYCGIGRRYHSVVCSAQNGRQNVSAAVCEATGTECVKRGFRLHVSVPPFPYRRCPLQKYVRITFIRKNSVRTP